MKSSTAFLLCIVFFPRACVCILNFVNRLRSIHKYSGKKWKINKEKEIDEAGETIPNFYVVYKKNSFFFDKANIYI